MRSARTSLLASLLAARLALPLLVAGAGGCSTTLEENGVTFECSGDVCPTEMHVAEVVRAFADRVPGYDEFSPLHVVWRDDADLERTAGVHSFSMPWYDEVHVASSCLLVHEMMHVWLWRATGDDGYYHLDGVDERGRPWPWTLGAERAVKDVCEQYRGDLAF